jgi:hypothetical protein
MMEELRTLEDQAAAIWKEARKTTATGTDDC